MTVTHDHSSPYYSSTAWGAWAFQDVFDVRFYEYYAERMAHAVEHANANLRPARVGAAVTQFDKTHRHSFGPAIADDGTPAGYPNSDADHDMTVVRFDDISDPSHPKPLANLVNYSLHGEMLEGNDLITADWVGAAPADASTARAAARHGLHAERRRHRRARAQLATTTCTSGSSSRTAKYGQAEYAAQPDGRRDA